LPGLHREISPVRHEPGGASRFRSRPIDPRGVVLRRTLRRAAPRYGPVMPLKPFSYLMIGVFASGLAMTVFGAVGVLAGS
jgi:hypothetical protein